MSSPRTRTRRSGRQRQRSERIHQQDVYGTHARAPAFSPRRTDGCSRPCRGRHDPRRRDDLDWQGNAGTWGYRAARYGYTVTSVPMPKSIVVVPIGTFRHVGWVNYITQDAAGNVTLNVTEENYDNTGIGSTRTINWAVNSAYRYIAP